MVGLQVLHYNDFNVTGMNGNVGNVGNIGNVGNSNNDMDGNGNDSLVVQVVVC